MVFQINIYIELVCLTLNEKCRVSQPSTSQAARGSTLRNMKWTNIHDVVLLHIMLEMRKEGKVLPGGVYLEGMGSNNKGNVNKVWVRIQQS